MKLSHILFTACVIVAAALPQHARADVSGFVPQVGQTYVIPADDGHVIADNAQAWATFASNSGLRPDPNVPNYVVGFGEMQSGTGSAQRTVWVAVAQVTAPNTYLILENHQYNLGKDLRVKRTGVNSDRESCAGTQNADYATVVTLQGGGVILTDVGATFTLPVSNC
jgi:hypothetical protein